MSWQTSCALLIIVNELWDRNVLASMPHILLYLYMHYILDLSMHYVWPHNEKKEKENKCYNELLLVYYVFGRIRVINIVQMCQHKDGRKVAR